LKNRIEKYKNFDRIAKKINKKNQKKNDQIEIYKNLGKKKNKN